MVAIDPPYRFDPWQNLVNVHWERGTNEFPHQFFIFRRWSGDPINGPGVDIPGGLRFSGDWYPLSDQFIDAAYEAGELYLDYPIPPGTEISTGLQLIAFSIVTEARTKRSDLIKDGLKISLGISETDRTSWPGSFAFYYWSRNSLLLPGLGTPVVQPSRDNSSGYVYYAIAGTYEQDDMTANDWSDLSSGVGAFDGVPQFTPP